MSSKAWWSTKISAKLFSDLVSFSIFSFDFLSDIHESIRVVTRKYLMYFLACRNT